MKKPQIDEYPPWLVPADDVDFAGAERTIVNGTASIGFRVAAGEMNSVDLGNDVLDHFVSRARRLYSLPAVALRVLELTATSSVDVQELAACVEQDPALTTKILRVVNSSMFGLNQRVSTVKQSIALLGTQPLKMLVLGFSLPGNLASNTGSLVLQRYWQQTLLTAIAAREIAENWFHLSGDDAFAAGLLQDLGLLLLVQDLGESYEKFLVSVWQQSDDVLVEERRVLGFDHQFLTAKLLEHWHLPEPFVASIAESQAAELIGEQKLAHVLHLAHLVAGFLIHRQLSGLNKLLHVGEPSCGLTMPKLELLIAVLEKRMPQLAELLSLELPGNMVYSDVLLQAHKRLAEMTDHAAIHSLTPAQRPSPVLWERIAAASVSDVEFDEPHALVRQASSTIADGDAQISQESIATTTCPRSTRAGLIGRITAEVARCRQARSAISLVIVELDHLSHRTLIANDAKTKRIVDRLGATIQEVADEDGRPTQLSDIRFALLLRCDRRRAVDIGWRITDYVRSWSDAEGHLSRIALSVSIGVATLSMPPRNFPAEELLIASERCLTGVQLSGGDSVKSIDIY